VTIAVTGHLCVDLTPGFEQPPSLAPGMLFAAGPLAVSLGGSVANTARTLRTLDVPHTVSAAIGDDALAEVVLRILAEEGHDVGGIRRLPRSTTSYSIVIQAPGRDRTFWHHAGANDEYEGSDIDLADVDILHLGYPPLLAALSRDAGEGIVSLFSRARAAGVATSLDLAVVDPAGPAAGYDWTLLLQRVLPLTDIVSPSRDDLRSLAPYVDARWATGTADALARSLVEIGAGIAMVSDGDAGFALATGDTERLSSAGAAVARLADWGGAHLKSAVQEPQRFVSTNGAGDAATAGLLAAIIAGSSPEAALRSAAAAAAASIEGRLDEPLPGSQSGRGLAAASRVESEAS